MILLKVLSVFVAAFLVGLFTFALVLPVLVVGQIPSTVFELITCSQSLCRGRGCTSNMTVLPLQKTHSELE